MIEKRRLINTIRSNKVVMDCIWLGTHTLSMVLDRTIRRLVYVEAGTCCMTEMAHVRNSRGIVYRPGHLGPSVGCVAQQIRLAVCNEPARGSKVGHGLIDFHGWRAHGG